MSVDFGKVTKYVDDRGFGFVRGLLLGSASEIFFHITTIKKANPHLAASFADHLCHNDVFFWFDAETTPKGPQVRSILSGEMARAGSVADVSRIILEIESLWRNISSERPSWLEDATIDLLGYARAHQLSSERRRLEDEERNLREQARADADARLAIERQERQRQLDAKRALDQVKEREFNELVAEMGQLGFTHSSQVSSYIIGKRLGLKYRNISGVLQMELDGTVWDFKGGFPPEIYARLCHELGLSNAGSRARPIAFESFDSIEARSGKP